MPTIAAIKEEKIELARSRDKQKMKHRRGNRGGGNQKRKKERGNRGLPLREEMPQRPPNKTLDLAQRDAEETSIKREVREKYFSYMKEFLNRFC